MLRKKRCLLMLAVLAFVIAILMPNLASSFWTTTEVVSTESTGDSSSPSLGVGSDGTVHLVWQDNTNYTGCGTDPDIFYKRYVPSSGWSTTEVVSTESTSGSVYPSLGVGSGGTVHVAWYDRTNYAGCGGTDYDIFYKRYVPGQRLVYYRGGLNSEHRLLFVSFSGCWF